MSKYVILSFLSAVVGFLPFNAEPADPVTYLNQGWSPGERTQFYTTPQGSLLMPYTWFINLEQASNDELFRSSSNIERLRYIPGMTNAENNPDSLPVGFVKEPTEKLRESKEDFKLLRPFLGRWGKDETSSPATDAWLGFTCAACHTTQIEVKGKRLRIDGGPAMADFNSFIRSLTQAIEATINEKIKYGRFADKVIGKAAQPADREALRQRLIAYSAAFAAYRDRNSPQFAHGFGRVDALGLIMNEVFGTALQIPANYRINDAPVSYPELWYTPKLDWVQWNGSVANPFARNVGEVLGAYGHAYIPEMGVKGIPSSVRGKNLHDLEQLIAKLEPPMWNEDILGKLDLDQVKRGAAVYETAGCAKCHANKAPYPMTEPNQAKRQFIKTNMISLKTIGTDQKTATNFVTREALPGLLGQANGPSMRAADLLSLFVTQVVARQFEEMKLNADEQKEYNGFRNGGDPPNLLAYKAKPLAGVWATAPYLHNGSVPSLYELLQSPAQRVKTFYTGSREFDPKTVGFKTERFEGGFLFDTNLPGNSNAGHIYGTDRTPGELADLIEYLKTL
jgi:hypothetical protein